MEKYYLAIDIGASSGRHILGTVRNGRLLLEEVYRFENGMKNTENGLEWDIDYLYDEVIKGIARCKMIGKPPFSIAIDTWSMDYVLLDEEKNELLPVYAFRDARTKEIFNSPDFPISCEELYQKTGIQNQAYNTVYQLYADKLSGKLSKARHFLMLPEYLSYKLTGNMVNEYTNATSTSMVNAHDKEWDKEIISKLGFPEELFLPLSEPGTSVGIIKDEIARKTGFKAEVVLAPSHDTASAVTACPIGDKSVYISSGTWSIMGTETLSPILTEEARLLRFTNEGGVEYRNRFLKNIMGMWVFQCIKKELGNRYSYSDMMELAETSRFDKIINVNDERLIAPENMIAAVNLLIKETHGDEGISIASTLCSVYHSMAKMYADTVSQIERVSGKTVESIFIVGGGCKDKYLNRLTEEYSGKKVLTGLEEATATGNIVAQIIAYKNISLVYARKLVADSAKIG